jgi:hypothetical protein
VVTEPAPLPGDDRGRLNEDQGTAPACPGPGEPCPEEPIGELGASTRVAPLVDGELVAQGEDFDLEGEPPAEAAAHRHDEREENGLHGR